MRLPLTWRGKPRHEQCGDARSHHMTDTRLTLKNAASFVRTSRAPVALLSILQRLRSVFCFAQERANRLKRFVVIVTAYKRGRLVRDIESEYGCSRQTVLRYARLAGCSKRPKGFDPEIRRATISLYKQGKPIAEIQARLGVSQAYVSKTATEEGINRRHFR